MFQKFYQLPERLKRVTSGSDIIPEIDGLRFIAIFTVLIQHLHERFIRNTSIQFSVPVEESLISYVSSRGIVGVYVFFVISGFILALPFARRILGDDTTLGLKKYYIRRLTRLEPPYIIWMTILFISFLVFKKVAWIDYLSHYLATITYTHALFFYGWSPINPPTWTLEVEVQFYLIAPFLTLGIFLIKKKIYRRALLICCTFIFMIIQQQYEFFRFPVYLTILAYLHYFMIGFFLADIYLCDWRGRIKQNILFDILAIISFALIIAIYDWEFYFIDRIAVVLLLFLFFYSVFRGHYVNIFFTNRWITAIGGMCYTIYLIHLPLAEFLMSITKHIELTDDLGINLFVQSLFYLPIVLIVSSIGFLLFEKPFMNKNWPQRLKGKIISLTSKGAY